MGSKLERGTLRFLVFFFSSSFYIFSCFSSSSSSSFFFFFFFFLCVPSYISGAHHFFFCVNRLDITVQVGWALNITYLLIYLCPSLPVEHRPSTTPRHRTLFWAALVIPDQLVPCCFSSASVSRLQLLRGWPLFLFPCGFQVRAWRVVLDAGFLRVCPIQPHILRSICLATGSYPTRSHRSSFRIFSCHWIL